METQRTSRSARSKAASLQPERAFEFKAQLPMDIEYGRVEAILWPLLIETGVRVEETASSAADAPSPTASRVSLVDGLLSCRVVTRDAPALAPYFWTAVYAIRNVATDHFQAGEAASATRPERMVTITHAPGWQPEVVREDEIETDRDISHA